MLRVENWAFDGPHIRHIQYSATSAEVRLNRKLIPIQLFSATLAEMRLDRKLISIQLFAGRDVIE